MGSKRPANIPEWATIRKHVNKMTFELADEFIIHPFQFAEQVCEMCGCCDLIDVAAWMGEIEDPDRRHQKIIWRWVQRRATKIKEILGPRFEFGNSLN